MATEKKPFSFKAIMSVVRRERAYSSLSAAREEGEIIYWLTGHDHIGDGTLDLAREELCRQFPKLADSRLVDLEALKVELEKGDSEPYLGHRVRREDRIQDWLRATAKKLGMDSEAYYLIQRVPPKVYSPEERIAQAIKIASHWYFEHSQECLGCVNRMVEALAGGTDNDQYREYWRARTTP